MVIQKINVYLDRVLDLNKEVTYIVDYTGDLYISDDEREDKDRYSLIGSIEPTKLGCSIESIKLKALTRDSNIQSIEFGLRCEVGMNVPGFKETESAFLRIKGIGKIEELGESKLA